MNTRKELVNQIINNSINIICCDLGKESTSDNKCYIKFLHNTNKTISGAIKKYQHSFTREYNDHFILRDEVYACYYEDILKVVNNKDYTDDDLRVIADDINYESEEITREFCKLVTSYMHNDIRANLIDPTRRDQRGGSCKLIDTKTLFFGSTRKLEKLMDDFDDESSLNNEFNEWFIDHKEELLTKKQLKYFNNEDIKKTLKTEFNTNSRIRNSINDNKEVPQTKQDAKEKLRLNKIKTIEDLLNIEDYEEFIASVKKSQSKVYISDAIISYVSQKERIKFNKNIATTNTVKEYRIALFNLLDQLNKQL